MFGETLLAFEQICGDVVAWVEAIACMNFAIDAGGNGVKHLFVGKRLIFFNPAISTGRQTIVHTAFLAHDAGTHVVQVVLLGFLISRIVAFELELFGFQIVARIVFVGDGERYEVHVA